MLAPKYQECLTLGNNVVLATKKSHTTPLKPSSTTASLTTAPNTPSSSREAAIQAKIQSTAERIKKVASLKDKWAKENNYTVLRVRYDQDVNEALSKYFS